MQVSSSVSGTAFTATMTRWQTTDTDLYYWYTQEDNTISFTVNSLSSEVTVVVSTTTANYTINVYCTSVIDLCDYVREVDSGATVDVNFYEDGEFVTQWSGDVTYGYYPTEVVIPPPFLPYHDGDDEIRIPLIATTPDGCFEARTADGSMSWSSDANMETAVILDGGYGLLWRVEDSGSWSYSHPLKIPNGCETINLRWYGRNGTWKAWVFEVSAITTEVADPTEIITSRGIGLRRIGAPSRTLTIKTTGCNVYTRKWLSDLATSPVTYAWRRYYDGNYEMQRQSVPVTCESVEIDLSERVADFEATINIEKGRAL